LNYKDTLWSVPLKPVWARRWLWRLYLFSFQNLYASQSREYCWAQFSNKQQKSSYQFFTSRFSLSEKLHLETGLAFNTTRYSLRDLLQQGTIPTCIPLGSMVTAGGTLL
jgi:iron complex outermembrane receptor protein